LFYFKIKMKYDHQTIEQKWQKIWEKSQADQAIDFSQKPKKYVLDMFPYPSGAGLHVGHAEGYTATDIYCRYLRMNGFNVLHPMGWDAFGLPTENYAIKVKRNPKEITKENTNRFRRQLKSLGFSYDWSREINTSQPDYYKWTQWLFLSLFKKNLAYQRKAPVNWCQSCQTVLAREQVINGLCERCKKPVIQKELKQWFFKITAYAEELLSELDKLDWPEPIKEMQRNWIGKSEGALINFKILAKKSEIKKSETISVFTTRPDTLFGATYLVLAPEHSLIANYKSRIKNYKEILDYIKHTVVKTELDRTDLAKEKTGVELRGVKAINPATKEAIPIWVADYVLMSYGTGAIMAVPAHDSRDFEFAKKYKLTIKQVIDNGQKDLGQAYTGEGKLVNSGGFNGLNSQKAKEKIVSFVGGQKITQYKLRDWLISRQRYWGAPIPIIHCANCGAQAVPAKDLPVELPADVDFTPHGHSPLKESKKFKKVKCQKCGGQAEREYDTMDTFICSSWYYLRYIDPKNQKNIADDKKVKYWLPVDVYVGGAEHAVLHLLYSRFITKVLRDVGVINFGEPFIKLKNQGLILAEDGRKMSKSLGNVISPDEVVKKYGADVTRMYEMFMGPLEEAKPWDTKGIMGIVRFIERVCLLSDKVEKSSPSIERIQNLSGKIGQEIESFKFNTAVAKLMIISNELSGQPKISQTDFELFIKVLAPFAPHLSEELWQKLGNKQSIFKENWPRFKIVKAKEIEFVTQINGKVRDRFRIDADLTEEKIKRLVYSSPKIKIWLANKSIKKEIFVANKLLNIVI